MKAIRILYQFLAICLIACGNNSPAGNTPAQQDAASAAPAPVRDSFPTGKIINPVLCRADTTQSYALYIPVSGSQEALPVLYLFDPHGKGDLPLLKYRSLADTFGFILVGSNNSRNGNDWNSTEAIWQQLSADIRQRVHINEQLQFTGGFSGGAKVAGYVALRHPGITGVIANGAGLPDGAPAGDFPFSFTAVTGEGDMNMTDLVSFCRELDNTHTRHRIIFFPGRHEWAFEQSMRTVFQGLRFDAMKAGRLPGDQSAITRYSHASKKRVDSLVRAGQPVRAVQEAVLSVSFLDGLSEDAGWFREQAASLARNPLFQQQQKEREAILAKEENTRAEYMQHFQPVDLPFWERTIADLQAKTRTRNAETAMNQRLLAYLSLAFYSLSNHLIQSDAWLEAGHYVELYKLADPTNSEAWYFSAILHAHRGETPAAETDLLKATSLGFNDTTRLLQQPEFQQLPAPLNFPRITASMPPTAGNTKNK